MAAAPRPDSAREMRRRLRAKYGRTTQLMKVPEHLVLFEVPVDSIETKAERYHLPEAPAGEHPSMEAWARQPGYRRRIDAVAVGMWRGTGHLVHGFEIKVSRSDLLAELRNPRKAEAAVRACDRWWLALSDPRLLRDGDEVPDGWGVLAARGRGLTVVHDAGPQPGVRDGQFLAALLGSSLRYHGICRGLGYMNGYQDARRQFEQSRRSA